MTKTLSTGASEIIAANASRKSLTIQNEDTTNSVYIKREMGELLSVSATDHDLLLGPGASFGVNSVMDGTQAIQSRYTGIASAGTPRVGVFESEDQRR
jgi:hypothetical protein